MKGLEELKMSITRISSDNQEEYGELLKTIMPAVYQDNDVDSLECYAVFDENEVCGVVAASIKNEMPFIECIYVMPHLRFMGYGGELLNAVELSMVTNGYESIAAVYFIDPKTGQNEFGMDAKSIDVFLEKQGYFVTKLGNGEDIKSDEEKNKDIEIKYATKVFS